MINYLLCGGVAVSYKLFHLMIERDIANAQLMRDADIPTNIITKLKNGQYYSLGQGTSICPALNCGADDILEFVSNAPKD